MSLILQILFVLIFSSCPTLHAADDGFQIIAPKDGVQYSPGDKLSIEVEILPGLHATDCSIAVKGLGILTPEKFDGKHFSFSFEIPKNFAGPLTLNPSVYAGDLKEGQKVTVNVKPQNPPLSLVNLQRNYFLAPDANDVQLYVSGKYAEDITLDLSSSVTGTTYVSSDPKVVLPNTEGLCNIVGKGNAVISVENQGLKDFVMFVIEDAEHPNPPVDITAKVTIKMGAEQEELNGNRVIIPVVVTNISDLPLVGPLQLSITDVGDGARAYADKVSLTPVDGLNLFPGQSITVEVIFLRWRDVKITYALKLLQGTITD